MISTGMRLCHRCKKEIPETLPIGRREECPSCKADLHCCRNCAFFDPTVSKQCREPVAEHVKDKERANYCDYFDFAQARSTGDGVRTDQARKALEDLFKPGGKPS